MPLIQPVILSGGSGHRLWPMSRALHPKQFLPLATERPMLAETALRLAKPQLFSPPLLIANVEHRFVVAEQLRKVQIAPTAIVLEPVGRNTAAAVAIAVLQAPQPETLLLIAPSDAVVRDDAVFHHAVAVGRDSAAAGRIVTFGITPTHAETAYGYIKMAGEGELIAHPVERFVEKPDAERAASYLAEGGYVWNSGMFLFRADVMRAELERLQPELMEKAAAALAAAASDLDFIRLDEAAFGACPDLPIDVAVMEKTTLGSVVPVSMGWSDVGSWGALWDVSPRDPNGNVLLGDVIVQNVSNSYVRSTDGRLVAATGIEDMIVVATDDAVFLCPRERSQDVRLLVQELKARKRREAVQHTVIYRPWGSYQTVDEGERFQVKRLIVKPGAKLSSQMHHHRAEHWIVVRGTAKVTRNDAESLVFENESIYLPIGTKHRLENPGKIDLHLIEVQSGAYLGEDDIVRFEDVYGRG
ncbi:MAG: mannose-1-phosphate guanylyltransferase/mannose-6-phosphate isomerase [Alphaproteobacteria bacterium]|nr:mannose-1-phosphate guanylyltransferase/mannose-6-phosphate isomerase [Alphaproteobacteria bacterium]